MGMQQARIYLMGNNLCVWDNLKMWDRKWVARNQERPIHSQGLYTWARCNF